jgi:cytochrome c oxidase subunit III
MVETTMATPATTSASASAESVAGAGKVGMWTFLITDAMGFAAMLIAYGVLRARATTWPDANQRLAVPLAAAMTFTLLTSSLTVLFALTAARAGRGLVARAWLAVTMACALGFLGAQAYEYRHLLTGTPHLGLTTDLFASTFYVITGFHGVHVLAGLIVLGVVLVGGRGRPPSPAVVEVAALFWHFVDLAWVPIFTFLYLLPAR